MRSLAELYTQKKQFDRALALYDRIKNSEMGNDPSLERAIADTIVRRFDYQVEQLDPSAPDYAEQVGENPGGEAGFPGHRMPEARGKIPDRPGHPV